MYYRCCLSSLERATPFSTGNTTYCLALLEKGVGQRKRGYSQKMRKKRVEEIECIASISINYSLI
uniref:Uncharacterized protein n=1 Tax=Solanum lycopersicum TaxID=4081 RepID=A0A3Q7G5Z2_SOLLC